MLSFSIQQVLGVWKTPNLSALSLGKLSNKHEKVNVQKKHLNWIGLPPKYKNSGLCQDI